MSLKAQDTNARYIPDQITRNGQYPCGVTAEYIRSLGVATGGSPGGPMGIIVPSLFPAHAIDTCGVFRVFYEDVALGTFKGFHDVLKGVTRRAAMCQALSYIQTVFDFSSIGAGHYIRMHVDTSYTSSYPAPPKTVFLARAAPFHSTAPGVTNGFVRDFILTGTDPAASPDDYHSNIQVNFDKTYPKDALGVHVTTGVPINWHDDGTTSVEQCTTDLPSTLLHEITHTLGWLSLVEYTSSYSTGTTVYSSIDTSIHLTTYNTSLTTLSKGIVSGSLMGVHGTHHFWLNGKQTPYNHPIFMHEDFFAHSDVTSSFSHLDEVRSSYAERLRNSPGDWQDYVMTSSGLPGVERRVYTKGEIETLHNIIGYSYSSATAVSPVAVNHVPWSSKMSSVLYDQLYEVGEPTSFQDLLPADTTISNDIDSVYVIHLWQDTTLHDADGDSISFMPGTLVNFRGCGEGGNNHNLVTISDGGKTITYRPRHNFYGRVQFGGNLWDGHEKGGFAVYTIDVNRGTNVKGVAGENLVLNGDFEEGSEVKIRDIAEGVNNTSQEFGYKRNGRLFGAHFSDSHPFDYLTNAWMTFGGGTAIKYASAACDSTTMLKYGFGVFTNAFPVEITTDLSGTPIHDGRVHPLAKDDVGDRYQPMLSGTAGYLYLADSLKSCHKYILEFDYYNPEWMAFTRRFKPVLSIGFTDSGKADFKHMDYANYYTRPSNYILSPVYPLAFSGDWSHARLTFNYCSDTASTILVLKPTDVGTKILIDNISIIEDTVKTTVAIVDSFLAPCGDTRLYAKVTHASTYHCLGTGPVEYTWTANGDTTSHDSVIYRMPLVTTTYIAYIFDGCHIVSDTIILAPSAGPIVIASDTAICKRDSTHFILAVSGTVGTVTYTWSPSTGLSCTSCANPFAKPDTTTTYWVTVTDAVSCFTQAITITVRPLPEIYVSNHSVCSGIKAEVKVTDSGSGPYIYKWLDSGVECDTCMTTYTNKLTDTTTFLVTATDTYGCHSTDSTSVIVLPKPIITISPRDTSLCFGDTLTLHAMGGSPTGYHWQPTGDGLSCYDCSDPKAFPLHDIEYSVVGNSAYGCEGNDTIKITSLSLPLVNAGISADTVCPDGTVTLTGSGAISYSWKRITGDVTGITCPTCLTTAATVYTATSYIVTGVGSNGCIKRDTVTADLFASPTISVTPSSITTCADDSTGVMTASGGVSYSWSPTTGLGCSACASTKAASHTAATLNYTVYGTDAHGCVNSDIATVTVNDCPCGPRTVFGRSSTTLAGTISGSLAPGYYYIDADITITGNPTFTGAKILVGPNVTITVSDTTKLTLDSCHFMACPFDNDLWNGIVLASGSTKSARIEVKNNTLIEDAYIAIKAVNPFTPSSGNVIKTDDAVFNRNVQSIYIENYTTSASTYPFSVTKTIFTGRKFNDTTVTGYPATWPDQAFLKARITNNGTLPPFYIDKNYAKANCRNNYPAENGIRLINIGRTTGSGSGVSYNEIVIGDGVDSARFNLYDNIGCGINATNTNITSYNNTFASMLTKVGATHLGAGISATTDRSIKARLRVIEAPYNLPPVNRFYNCVNGVYVNDYYEVIGKQSFMTSSHTYGAMTPGASSTAAGIGYAVKGYFYKNIDLLENQISNIHLGISVISDNSKSSYSDGFINIKHNIIRNRNPIPPPAVATTGQYMYQAIKVQNIASGICPTCGGVVTGGVNIESNTIDSVYNGIDLSNFKVQTPVIKDNTIWLLKCTDNKRQAGISQSNSIGTISSNSVYGTSGSAVATSDTVRAYYLAQNSRPSVVSNIAENVGRAFEFVGTQTNTGWFCNQMQGNRKGLVLNSSIIGQQGGSSSPYGNLHDNQWKGSWGGTIVQTYCLNGSDPRNSVLYVRSVTSPIAYQPTVNGPSPIVPSTTYMTSAGSIVALSQGNSACTPPFTSPKQFSGVMHNLIVRGTLPYGHDEAINSWMSQYELYHDMVVDDSMITNSTQLQSFMSAAASSRFGWLTDIENALAEEDTVTAESLLSSPVAAAGYNVVDTDVVVTDTTDADYIVQNFVDFYGIYLDYLKGAGIDSDALVYLSNLCPLTNGTVVYQARALYSRLYDYNENYDEDSLCEINSYARLVQKVSIQQYGLYPNPNDGNLTLTQALADSEPVSGEVYNLVGQRVYKGELHFAGGVVHLHVGNITPGIYILHLMDKTGSKTTIKFNIK